MPICLSTVYLELVRDHFPDTNISSMAGELLRCREQLAKLNKNKISPSTRPRSRRREDARAKGTSWDGYR